MNKSEQSLIRLVVVDDHILFREGLIAIVRSASDVEVVGQAGSVSEAIELVRVIKPDIILMDFGLPDGTGADATRAILKEHPECKIVFLTMSEEDEDLFTAIRSGARGYLLKNLHPTKLISTLRSVQQGESALSRTMTLRVMEELSRTRKAEYPPEITLTHREIDVLRAVAAGLSNQDIANHLFITENTVKYHVHSILDKLKLTSRKEAATYARKHGLIN
jgi:two-component system, NarL family, nitrate/nitrite response regulator NarL